MAPAPFRFSPMQAWEAPTPSVQLEEYPEDVRGIIREIQGYVFTRRVRAKDFFLDFDPLRCGRCSPHQFVRGLNAIVPHLRAEKMRVLTDFFTDPSQDAMKPQVVHHLEFLRAVDTVFGASELEKQPAAKAPRPGHCLKKHGQDISPCEDEVTVEQTLRRLALLVKTRGVIFSKCFQDSERSLDTSLLCPRFAGKVTEAQFCSHFPFMQDISEHELSLLLQRYYNADTGGISYMALDKEIQSLIDEPCAGSVQLSQSARSPMSMRQWAGPAAWSGREPMRLPSSQDQEQFDSELMARLKAEIASRRLRLHGSFQEVDRLRRGAVSMGQARTVFTILRIELDSKELEMLHRLFDLNGLFNYRQFCNEVLEVPLDSEDFSPATSFQPSLGSAFFKKSERVRVRHRLLPDAEEHLAEAELWVARRAEHRTINVKSHFLDFDRLRCGRVTRSQRCLPASVSARGWSVSVSVHRYHR
ncbi:SAMS2 [Symbiodinium sp. CCMP2456]|nr:SAMS2 [Symbiodinium sp. CCMP2456]